MREERFRASAANGQYLIALFNILFIAAKCTKSVFEHSQLKSIPESVVQHIIYCRKVHEERFRAFAAKGQYLKALSKVLFIAARSAKSVFALSRLKSIPDSIVQSIIYCRKEREVRFRASATKVNPFARSSN